MDCRPLGSPVHRIFQARILEWVAISFSKGSSWTRDQIQVSCVYLHWQGGSLPLAPPEKPWDIVEGIYVYIIWQQTARGQGGHWEWGIRLEVCHKLEKAMAPHSSTLAWKIPWTEEPGRLQSMESRRVGHDWATSLSLFPFMHWRRKQQPTPVFLPRESQGRGSLVGCRLWGHIESDTTEVT